MTRHPKQSLGLFITRFSSPTLLKLVIEHKINEVKTLLEKHPHLALETVHDKVIDYSGRTLTNVSSFQAALCAGDTEMYTLIKNETLASSSSILQNQFNQIFPQGLAEHKNEQLRTAFNLEPIKQAIIDANDTEIQAALDLTGASFKRNNEAEESKQCSTLVSQLNAFREDFTAHALNETVFNPTHLLQAFELLFDDKALKENKATLFWRQVIGFIQRFLPVCDTEPSALKTRILILPNQHPASFYPLSTSLTGAGFTQALWTGLTPQPPSTISIARRKGTLAQIISTYQAKFDKLSAVRNEIFAMPAAQDSPDPRC